MLGSKADATTPVPFKTEQPLAMGFPECLLFVCQPKAGIHSSCWAAATITSCGLHILLLYH